MSEETEQHQPVSKPQASKLATLIFDDPEAKRNFVGLFNQLLQMDMRNHPENYKQKDTDHD